MSIISDALKKVEGNSASQSSKKRGAPQIELVDAPAAMASPPLFSVWSIMLSTVMVLVAAVLLLATWYMNRTQNAEVASVTTVPISSPVEVVVVPKPDVSAGDAPSAIPPVSPTAPAPAKPAPTVKPKPAPVAEPKPPAAGTSPAAPVELPDAEKEAVASAPASSPTAPVGLANTPTAKPESATPTKKRDELVLTGVVYTPRVRMAHINGKILPEGAEIEGYRIVTVSRESVRLSKDDKFYILRLKR